MTNKRRRNGEGTFYTQSRGKGWEYRITYRDCNGKSALKYFTGATKNICLEKAKKFKNELNGIYDENIINSEITLSQWANYWFDNYVSKGQVKITTISDDRSILDCHIIPGLGHHKLIELTGIIMQNFYNNLAKKDNGRNQKLSPKRIKNVYSVINRMLVCAYNNDLIGSNPNAKTKLPKRPLNKLDIPNADEHDIIITDCLNCKTNLDYTIYFMISTGTQLAECLGLQWDNVDLEKGTVTINRQLQAVPNLDKNAKTKFKQAIIHATKTKHSNRTIPIYDDVLEVLKKIKHQQKINRFRYGQKYRSDLNLVFCKNDGKYICDTVLRDYFNKKLNRLKIHHYRLHDLRHSFATRATEEEGLQLKGLSEYLGHSCVGITQDLYVHGSAKILQSVIDKTSHSRKKYFNNSEKFKDNSSITPKKGA